jgi:hypothetical protein
VDDERRLYRNALIQVEPADTQPFRDRFGPNSAQAAE